MEYTFFTEQALRSFTAIQGKTVKQVNCCMWQNNMDPERPIEIIDHVQFHFTDGSSLSIGCNEEGNGLEVIEPDLKEMGIAVEREFGGKIKIFALNASGTSMWKDVIGKNLLQVQITKEGKDYRSDSIMLNFGEEKRTITLNPLDGLLFDHYE